MGFQYIADNYERFPARAEFTGESGLSVYPVREHYVVYVPMDDGVHIAAVLGRAQDIPNILTENILSFQRELAGYGSLPATRSRKSRCRKQD